MALLDFPTGPNTNDTTTQNGNTWKWNGTSWVAFNNLSLSSQVSGILAVQYGGTGFGGTYNKGDILYALSSNTFGKLAAGTANSVLSINGSQDLFWKADDSGTGSVGNGNTGGFAYYTGLNTVTSGTAFSYISGTNNVILTSGTLSLPGSTISSGVWAGTAISLANGGTNANLTANAGAIVYSAASALALSAVGNANEILKSNGTGAPTWVAQSTLTAGIATSAAQVNTDAVTATRYLIGTVLNTASGSTQLSTGSGITMGNNVLTATTFQGSLSGTASTSTTAVNLNTYTLSGTMYLTGQTSSTGAGSGASQFVASGISFVSSTGLLTATTFSGTATSAAQVNTDAVTATRYLVGTVLNTASGSTQLSTGSGITIGNNVLTATTFQGSLSGTASTSTTAVNLNTYTLSGTMYLTGQTSSTGAGSGASQFVASGISFVSSTGLLTATTFSGTATSAAQINTDASTATRFLVGTVLNTASGSTQLSTGSGITIGNNVLTATTFQGSLSGTASSAAQVNTDASTATRFLVGTVLNTASGSTQLSTGSGITIGNNVLTATTFQGSLSGTASTSTTAVNVNTYALSGTMYLTGQTSSSGAGSGASQLVGSGISFNSTSGLLTATSYAGSGILLSGIVTSLAGSTGISVNSATGAVTVTNTGVISLTGTANQVLVAGGSGSATSGNITLTLPQSIATTSSPSFADITITTGSNSTLATVGSSATSIVNKQYVDNLASGLDVHGSVRLVSIAAIGASYYQPNYGIGNTATGAYLTSIGNATFPAIDGVTIGSTGVNQRVLIAGGLTGTGKTSINGSALVTPANSNLVNGIYYVGSVGSGSSQWYLYRATDTDDNTELTGGTFTFVEEGASYADSGFVCTNDTTNLGPIQFGSTAITFSQFTGGGALSVGQGLTKVGNTIAAKVNLFSTGTASGTGFTQFNIGGAGSAGVADTGYYPTFSVRTSGTVTGSALLTLNSDGFSLIGSTSTNRTVTVTGSDITLTGGGNTLTLTGSITLPAPTQHGVAYGSSATTVAFLTAGGSGASVLTQTTGSAPIYLGQSQLLVGSATSAAQVNTDASTATRYLVGTVLNTASGSTQLSTGSGITIGNNVLTATTFQGSLSGTASTATTAVNLNTYTLSGTMYLTGQTSSTGAGSGASQFVGSGISFVSSTGLLSATTFSGTATSAAQINTDASTATRYLVGTVLNTASGSTQLSTGSGITIGNNVLTATTFQGSLSGTATSAAQINTDATTTTRYLVGTVLNTASGSTQLSTGSGITIGNNVLTATTFQGSLSGTASTSTTAVNLNTYTLSGTMYLTGQTSSTGAGSGASQFVGSGISFVSSTGLLTATTFSGTATSAAQVNTDASTATRYLVGTVLNTASGSTQLSTGSGITIGNNVLTATTFQGSLSGTASTSTTAVNLNTYTLSGTMYLTGQTSSTGAGSGASQFVGSGISFVSSTGLLTATTFSGTATSAAQVNTDASTATRYLVGTVLNTASGSTQLSTGSGITIGNNVLTATTFQGSLSGTATTATRVGITTTVTDGNLPIVFASDHQPSAALGSSTRLTINPSTGKITNGFWAGTAITTKYGGTGLDTVNANQLLIGASTGNTWATIGSSVVPVVAIGAAAPAQPGGAIGATQAGQLWWDSEYGVLKVYYVDATPTAQWVDATPVLGSSGGGSSTKRSYVMTFGAGFTPSTGADTVQILIPYAPDNTSKYYYIKRLDYRANTAGTGVSFYMERFTGGNAAFDVATGNRIHSGAGASFVASSGTFTTSYTQSSTGASFVSSSGVAGSVISGDYLRLNFSHINSAATMSVSIILEEQ